MDNLAYQEVLKGETGHKQAIEIEFGSLKVTINTMLLKFLRSVDITAFSGLSCARGQTYKTEIPRMNQAQE